MKFLLLRNLKDRRHVKSTHSRPHIERHNFSSHGFDFWLRFLHMLQNIWVYHAVSLLVCCRLFVNGRGWWSSSYASISITMQILTYKIHLVRRRNWFIFILFYLLFLKHYYLSECFKFQVCFNSFLKKFVRFYANNLMPSFTLRSAIQFMLATFLINHLSSAITYVAKY